MSSIIVVGESNTPLSIMVKHLERRAINTESLKNIGNQTDLRNIYRTLTAEHTFFFKVYMQRSSC